MDGKSGTLKPDTSLQSHPSSLPPASVLHPDKRASLLELDIMLRGVLVCLEPGWYYPQLLLEGDIGGLLSSSLILSFQPPTTSPSSKSNLFQELQELYPAFPELMEKAAH